MAFDKNSIGAMDAADPDEQELASVRKHPFGLILLYVQFGIALIAGLALIYLLLPGFVPEGNREVYGWIALAAVMIIGFVAIILLIATIIYRQNKLVVTDRHIIQVLQQGMFHRKISQLSLANVEDVTSEQSGFLASIFGYGLLKIETAGEQVNFHFNFCPNPNYYAKVILEAREEMINELNRGYNPID